MNTTLDQFHFELSQLFDKYGYVLQSLEEEIENDVRQVHSIDGQNDFLVPGSKQINLRIRGMRLKS